MVPKQGWRLDERFGTLKICHYEPHGVDTKPGISLKSSKSQECGALTPELTSHVDDSLGFEHDDNLENAVTEALPWNGSGTLTRKILAGSKAPSSLTLSALSHTVDDNLPTPPKSDYRQSTGPDIFDQLQLFAVRALQSTLNSRLSSVKASDEEVRDVSGDSEEHSYLSSAQHTPCPLKSKSTTEFFEQFVAKQPPIPFTIPFKGAIEAKYDPRRAKPRPVSKAPKAIESVLSHKWQSDERELLCILYRWYRCDDETQTPEAISALFNAMTGLNLKHRVVKKQFRNHLCLYGANAYPEFARACVQTPFDDISDANGQYARIHRLIQNEAQQIGVGLRCRQEDISFDDGRAARAKSDYTRRIYKRLVRTASQSSQSSLEGPSEQNMRSAPRGRAIIIDPHAELDELVDTEETGAPSSVSLRVPAPRPHLAFRVFNGDNKTVLKPFGFQAARFSHLDELLQEDAPLDFPELWNSHAIRHLNHDGGDKESAFVSVFVNLLQTMCNAPSSDAVIVVMDLNHPSLTEGGNKLHHAYDLLKVLKSKGLVPRAKGRNGWSPYLGLCEYVRWGDWPAASFIHVVSVRELEQLAAENTYVADFLHLGLLQNYSTGIAARRLREKNFTLNYGTARAMGKLAKVFGLCGGNATMRHITEFVRYLVDGWTVKATSIDDLQTLSDISFHFAVAFGSQQQIQTIMSAFIDGVREGMRNLEHYRQRYRS